MAPRSPRFFTLIVNQANEKKKKKKVKKVIRFFTTYHCTRVPSDVLQVFYDVLVEPNLPNMHSQRHLQLFIKKAESF